MESLIKMDRATKFQELKSQKTIQEVRSSNIQVTKSMYCKVASSNMSRLEAHAGFFRLPMKGIFDPYEPWPLDKKLISKLVTHVRTRNYTVSKSQSSRGQLSMKVQYLSESNFLSTDWLASFVICPHFYVCVNWNCCSLIIACLDLVVNRVLLDNRLSYGYANHNRRVGDKLHCSHSSLMSA